MRKINQKGQLNISFGWLFAIIVGAVILVLTIFGATKVIKTGQQEQQVVGAKELGILLNPLETGFESAVSTPLNVNLETRIYNGCEPFGNFGEQGIRLSEFSFNEWSPPGSEVSFENKYIFSKKRVEGKNFYIFSKPFEFPFKVADLIYLTPSLEEYCFVDAPNDIKSDLKFGPDKYFQENLKLEGDCSDESVKVCFNGGSNCDIEVKSDHVKKGKDKLYFEGDALRYAAIFSEKIVYECQVERLLKRTKNLAEIYEEKALLMSQRNCDTNLEEDLSLFTSSLEKVDGSSDLSGINFLVEEIENKNEYSGCKLW